VRFKDLPVHGSYLIEIEPIADERGFFARTFCREEFSAHGLVAEFSQVSISFNASPGTVRGLHFSAGPHSETKIVRCTAGALHDVIVDLRPVSPTYLKVVDLDLTAADRNAIYIPAGVAHGFQTLAATTEVLYMIDKPHVASAGRGIRWDDPAIKVVWPLPISVISERDRSFPNWLP
jgi:dTDP-4-dehydrorhamnose 3,5-epimerase